MAEYLVTASPWHLLSIGFCFGVLVCAGIAAAVADYRRRR